MDTPHATRTPDHAVLIVGAGPTGLTLAIELARRGITYRMIDKNEAPLPHSRAIAIQARTLELFEEMGIADAVRAAGVQIHGAAFHVNRTQTAHLTLTGIESPYPYMIALAQNETEDILRDRLAALGGRIDWGVSLTALVQDREGVDTTLTHADGSEERLRSCYVVGCDGAHSAVRHLSGLPFEGASYKETFQITDVHMDWQEPADEMYLATRDTRFLLIVPLNTPGMYRIFSRATAAEAAQEPTLADFQDLVDRYGPKDTHLSDPTWFSTFHLHHRKVAHYAQGRLFVAGDAAHIHSPAGGQGMNTGIQDAVNLAWKLTLVLRGIADDRLLATYHTERNAVGEQVLRTTDTIFRLGNARNPAIQAMRSLAIMLILPRRIFQKGLSQRISQVAIHYAPNAAVAHDPGGAGVRTGLRAPDADLVTAADGTPARLFPVLAAAPEQYTLLLFGGTKPTPAGNAALLDLVAAVQERYAPTIAPVLIETGRGAAVRREWNHPRYRDPEGAMHHRYAAEHAAAYLIRPDGYIAWRGNAADLDALRTHLQGVFGAAITPAKAPVAAPA